MHADTAATVVEQSITGTAPAQWVEVVATCGVIVTGQFVRWVDITVGGVIPFPAPVRKESHAGISRRQVVGNPGSAILIVVTAAPNDGAGYMIAVVERGGRILNRKTA